MFSMAFNTPTDYDFNTGLVNVNANSRNGQPQEYYTFTATRCKNYFSKGKFEQEIEGKLLIEKKGANAAGVQAPASTAGRPTANTKSVASVASGAANIRPNNLLQSQANAQDLENGANSGSGTGTTVSRDFDAAEAPANPQPANPPGNPTSSGDIDYNAGLAGTDPGATSSPQQVIAQDDSQCLNKPRQHHKNQAITKMR